MRDATPNCVHSHIQGGLKVGAHQTPPPLPHFRHFLECFKRKKLQANVCWSTVFFFSPPFKNCRPAFRNFWIRPRYFNGFFFTTNFCSKHLLERSIDVFEYLLILILLSEKSLKEFLKLAHLTGSMNRYEPLINNWNLDQTNSRLM